MNVFHNKIVQKYYIVIRTMCKIYFKNDDRFMKKQGTSTFYLKQSFDAFVICTYYLLIKQIIFHLLKFILQY